MANKIILKSQGTSGKINITTDTSYQNSQKSKEWAISPNLVDNEDYSSKYYAKKSKEASDFATGAIDDIETSKAEFDNSYNEKSQALNTQYTNYSTELETQKTETIQNFTDKETESITNINTIGNNQINKIVTTGNTQDTRIITEGNTQVARLQSEGQQQINNIQATGIYVKGDKLYYTTEDGEVKEFEGGGSGGVMNYGMSLYSTADPKNPGLLKATNQRVSGELYPGFWDNYVDSSSNSLLYNYNDINSSTYPANMQDNTTEYTSFNFGYSDTTGFKPIVLNKNISLSKGRYIGFDVLFRMTVDIHKQNDQHSTGKVNIFSIIDLSGNKLLSFDIDYDINGGGGGFAPDEESYTFSCYLGNGTKKIINMSYDSNNDTIYYNHKISVGFVALGDENEDKVAIQLDWKRFKSNYTLQGSTKKSLGSVVVSQSQFTTYGLENKCYFTDCPLICTLGQVIDTTNTVARSPVSLMYIETTNDYFESFSDFYISQGGIKEGSIDNPDDLSSSTVITYDKYYLPYMQDEDTGNYIPSTFSSLTLKNEAKDINDSSATDYDVKIDLDTKEFILPTLNGNEVFMDKNNPISINSFNIINTTERSYTLPYNAYLNFTALKPTESYTLVVKRNNVTIFETPAYTATSFNFLCLFNRGDTISISTNNNSTNWSTIRCNLYKAIGNGDLYWYVGNDITHKDEIDLSAMLSVLNNKTDSSLVDTKTDEAQAANASMPSNKKTSLTTGATGTYYTAIADGYFNFRLAGVNNIAVTNITTGIYMQSIGAAGYAPCVLIPVKKNDSVRFNYSGLQNEAYVTFIYAEGAVND